MRPIPGIRNVFYSFCGEDMTMRPAQFSIRSLMIAILLCGIAVPAMIFPGGHLVYLPLIPIFVLALTTYRILFGLIRFPRKLSVRNHWSVFTSGFLLVASIAVYASFFELTSVLFVDKQFASVQRGRIEGIDNPEALRDVALQLHAELIRLPVRERTLDGESGQLPPELAVLRPTTVEAGADSLFICMCRNTENYFGILVFLETAPFQHGDVQLADRIWYWETP